MGVILGCGPSVSTESGEGNEGGGGSEEASGNAPVTTTTTSDPMSTSTRGTSSSAGTTGSTPVPPGCECGESTFCTTFGDVVSAECGGDELCPKIETDCARPVMFYGCIGQEIILDESALSCALDALAMRTPGWFEIELQDLETGCGAEGCSYDGWRIQVQPDSAQAVVSNCYKVPLDDEPEVIDAARVLEDPAYFEQCKALPGGGAQLDCLFGGLQGGGIIECR